MKFSLEPFPGDTGFTQWRDAMKMVARLPGGIPAEFRKQVRTTSVEALTGHLSGSVARGAAPAEV